VKRKNARKKSMPGIRLNWTQWKPRNSKEKEKWKNVLPKKEKKHVTGIKMNEVPVVIAMTEVLDDSRIEDQIEVDLMIGDLEVVIVDHLVIAMTEVHVISEDPETIVVVLEMIVGLIVEMIERDRGMMIKVDHLGDQVLDHGGIVNVRKMQNGNQEAVMMMDHPDEILTVNLHPEDQMMLVIGVENLEMIVVLLQGMIVVHVIAMIEVAPVIAMIVVAPVISEDQGTTAVPETTVDLEISEDPEMTVDLEMIVVLVTGMIEEVIEVVTIGVLVHLEEEIGAEPVMLLEEMIVVEVDSVEEAIEIEVVIVAETVVVIAEPMIGDPLPVFCLQQEMIDEMIAVIAGMIAAVIVVVIVEMILHRSRLPNVNKVGRKPPMVEMVGLQFLKNKNYDDF